MDNKTITDIHYNFSPSVSDGKEIYGENYLVRKVGVSGVVGISEHPAAGEGDKWFYDIEYDTGIIERIFNPCRVFYSPTKPQL